MSTTISKEMKLDGLALDAALDAADDAYFAEGEENLAFKKAVLAAIRVYLSALSTPPQPEAQEPVAWWWTGPKGGFLADNKKPSWPCEPLYAHPHPRKGDEDGK